MAAAAETGPTPEILFSTFRQGRYRKSAAMFREFQSLRDKRRFLDPAIAFLAEERDDPKRAWATSVLGEVGGARAFDTLTTLLETDQDPTQRRRFRYTRLFALRAIQHSAATPAQRERVEKLVAALWVPNWRDAVEDFLLHAEATVLLALSGSEEAHVQLEEMLDAAGGTSRQDFFGAWATLRALREFSVPDVTPQVVALARKTRHLDHQWYAVRALGSFRNDPNVVQELATISRSSNDSYIRLAAVMALTELNRPDAAAALIDALADDNAEVRYQAADGVRRVMKVEDAVRAIVPRALVAELPHESLGHLTDALRMIEPERTLCSELLNRELSNEDRDRAELAERILLELGGWAALHRLSQRRSTLESLDKIVRESEKIVNRTFDDMIGHARINFRFAMTVNVAIVAIGLVLIGIAVHQVLQTPDKLAQWLVPGGAGVFAILLNLFFNNPRKNAREDLGALVDVVAIFLGFTRQLNEIDATFKYAYIENPKFGLEEMRGTVQEIDAAVERTIALAARRLGIKQPRGARLRRQPSTETQSEPAAVDGRVATLGSTG